MTGRVWDVSSPVWGTLHIGGEGVVFEALALCAVIITAAAAACLVIWVKGRMQQ